MTRTLPRRLSALILCLCLLLSCMPAHAAELAITAQPQSAMVPDGKNVSVSLTAVGDGLSYQWFYTENGNSSVFKVSGNTGSSYNTTMTSYRNGRKVYCIVRDAYGNTVQSDTVTLSMGVPFAITQQPASGKFLNNKTATATVKATGEGLTYQWYYTENGSSATFLKSSNTTATYSTTMTSYRSGRKLYCVITDKNGEKLTTNTVTLSLGKPLTIKTQPQNAMGKKDETVSVTVVAEGEGLTYQWYYTENASSSTFLKSSQTTATYSVAMNESRNGRKVYCIIKDQFGYTKTSSVAALYMGSPLTITGQPQSGKFLNNTTATATVKAEGEGLTYQWYYTETGSSNTFLMSSNTTATYSTTMNAYRDGRKIYCVVKDQYGVSVTSATATLTMAEALKIVQQPQSAMVANGKTASATVIAKGEGLTYQWYYTESGNSSIFLKSSNTTNVYSAIMNEYRSGRQVYCTVKDQFGKTVNTDIVTLSMGKPLVITAQPVNITTDENAPVSVAVVAQGEGITYQWYYTDNGDSSTFLKSSNATNIYSTTLTAARNGRRLYCLITDKYGNTVTSETVTLSIKVPISIITQPQDAKVELGHTASVSVEATGNALTYQWYYTENGNSSEFLPSANDTPTYSIILSEETDGRQVFCVITDEFGNSLQTNIVMLRTRAELTIHSQPASITAADGSSVAVSVVATGDGLTYQWYYTDNGSSNTFKISSVTTATYTTVMNSSRAGRKIYCVVKDEYGNQKTTATATLNMGSAMAILFQPASVAVSNGQTARVTVIATGDDLTYQWYYTENGSSNTFLTSSNTTFTYSTVMNTVRDGRKVYCVIKDKHGTTLQTITVTLSMLPD